MSSTAESLTVRPIDWPRDAGGVAAIPTAWVADRILRVKRGPLSFELTEDPLESPYEKDGHPPSLESLRSAQEVFVAERADQIIGVAGLYLSEWNLRPSLGNLRVAQAHRRQGVGRALVEAVLGGAQKLGARGLWLEVTNVNLAAISLYRSMGFRLCGLDEAMYMRWGLQGEIALFFLYEFDEQLED